MGDKLSVWLPEDHGSAVGRMDFAAQVLERQSLSVADVVGHARRAHQPAVVHSGAQPPVLVIALALQSLRLFHLPAEFEHQRVRHHLSRLAPCAPVLGLAPAEPRHGHVHTCFLVTLGLER